MISVCIPCSDDQYELNKSIDSIIRTATLPFEVIVWDDGSKTPITYKDKRVKIFRGSNKVGVGYAIDQAVKRAKYEIIIISGADIVHRDDQWMSKFAADVVFDREAIFVSGTRGYNPDDDTFGDSVRYGSNMILKADRNDIPKVKRHAYPEGWRMLFRSKWYSKKDLEVLDAFDYKVPSILGALYAVSRRWYEHLRGFHLHRYWGSLDSFLAIKSWLAGGSCKIDPDIESGHIYSRNNTAKPLDWFIYNKIMVARTIFPEVSNELVGWMKDHEKFKFGLAIADSNPLCREVEEARDYYQSIFKHDYFWYKNKFGL